MQEYIPQDVIGLNNFLRSMSLLTKEGWEPIWTTFKEDCSDKNLPKYFVILERKVQYRTKIKR